MSWLQTADGIAPARALEINSLSMAVLLPVVIATGLLTDRVGRKPVLMLACILGFVGALPAFLLLNHPSGLMAQLGQLGLVWLVNRTGQEIAPAFLIMAAAAVTFATLLWFRETYRAPFIGGSSGAAAAYA